MKNIITILAILPLFSIVIPSEGVASNGPELVREISALQKEWAEITYKIKDPDKQEQAVSINPDGMDPNYFYGNFLIEAGEYQKAVLVLEHALKAQDRPNRAIADAGRRKEISVAIVKAKKKLR